MTSDLFFTVFPYWLKAFMLTLVFEVPIFVYLGKKLASGANVRIGTCRLIVAGSIGTCITHPLLWFVWPFLFVTDFTTGIVVGELLIVFIESATFYLAARPIFLKHAFITSLSANAASYGIGLVINAL